MKDFASMMKQAQQLQSRMAQMQEELETLQVEGSAGGGLVRVTLSGKGELRQVSIDPGLAKPEEVEIVEDLIIAAHGDAKGKLELALRDKMKEVTGGMPLPPGLSLGF